MPPGRRPPARPRRGPVGIRALPGPGRIPAGARFTPRSAWASHRPRGPAPARRWGPVSAEPAPDELRAALEAVREAIGIPHAATAGDAEIRREILYQRLLHAVAFLDHILGGYPVTGIPRAVAHLRRQLAAHPARGYKTWDELKAELEQQPAPRPSQAAAGARSGRPGRERRPGRPAPGGQLWTCRGCGAQFTGRRPPGGWCPACKPQAIP